MFLKDTTLLVIKGIANDKKDAANNNYPQPGQSCQSKKN